ncbi:hypothetical protein YC2023_012441 [Brassica napus]
MKKLFICGGELWTLDENGGPQGGYKWARIVIFWDIENCKVPSDCKAAQVREKILRSLWDLGSRGPVEIIAVAANESRVPSFVSSKLKLSGIRFDTLNTTVKQASDESIKRRIGRWMEVTPAHATLLLITRDKDFVLTLWKVERAEWSRANVLVVWADGYGSWGFRQGKERGCLFLELDDLWVDKDLCKRVHGYVVGDVFVKEFMDMFPTAFSSDLLQKPGTQSQTSPT